MRVQSAKRDAKASRWVGGWVGDVSRMRLNINNAQHQQSGLDYCQQSNKQAAWQTRGKLNLDQHPPKTSSA